MMNSLIERFKEPSSFAGLAGLALALGVNLPVYNAVTTVVAAVLGLVAVLKKEGTL